MVKKTGEHCYLLVVVDSSFCRLTGGGEGDASLLWLERFLDTFSIVRTLGGFHQLENTSLSKFNKKFTELPESDIRKANVRFIS